MDSALDDPYFWTIPNIDIYAATVPDRMHHLDLGLFRYQIEYTKELLGKSLEDKMNRRIAIIPRHPGLKIFAKGVQSIARLTASEFRDLMKVMPTENLVMDSALDDPYFWTIPNIDIYAATVPDRMHHLDLGLFRYQIEYTKELLGKSLEDKMNRRIAIIPRHPGLKIFAKGVQSIARLTASEFRDLMKVMISRRSTLDGIGCIFERFTESDLENFQIVINEWADLFITLFWDCSSGMKMPKLHSWIYHIVDAIRDFGAINGYTTETYESLHKTYVKIPYRLSNKKDVEMQIMKNIHRRAMILRNQVKETKTPRALTYTAKLFIINFSNITELCNQQKNNPNINETMRKGFKEFQNCLYEYLSELKKFFTEGSLIKIFGSVTLKNGAILRATNKFHGRPWFSNIAVTMNNEELSKYQSDKGICYAQTLLITEVNVPNESPFHLVLVQWYDYRFDQNSDLYDCPLLKLVEWYNFIEIEAIDDIVHMVPRFDETNEYFVNKYLF
ncbi:hypothetical protein Glove_477g10 [Diversispora epigaea]|uniref:Uncharacterized protein n=1 Tax=Diversispora epigaea TaxID=1348612 RepID=A0A397GPT6_9GLOM|nr:hypothetical protein Glove_477g10 [Diversispora epigaea]